MNRYRKNAWLAIAAFVLGFLAFPFSYSEAHQIGRATSELQSPRDLVCRLLL